MGAAAGRVFDSRGVERTSRGHVTRPEIVAEFEDTALLKTFGQEGVGLFVVPTVIEDEVRRQFGVRKVGVIEQIREKFYAISVERKVKNPAVQAIAGTARSRLFA